MLILGEVHTGLLQNLSPLSTDLAGQVLDLVPGEAVLVSERPISHLRSPEMLTGVDCGLAVGEGRPVRAIGTVRGRATLTGGHVIQGSAYTSVSRTSRTHRMPWSHYLAHPGELEALGRPDWPQSADAFLSAGAAPTTLDLGAVATQVADRVQRTAALDRRSKIKVVRTRMRWTAVLADAPVPAPVRVRFGVDQDGFRTLSLDCAAVPTAEIVAVCEDIALHDWLLTALLELVRKSALGVVPCGEALDRLLPAIDHLPHLWMPAARIGDVVLPVWEALERRPGFTRQWETLVRRIRDQLSVGAVTALAGIGRSDPTVAGVR